MTASPTDPDAALARAAAYLARAAEAVEDACAAKFDGASTGVRSGFPPTSAANFHIRHHLHGTPSRIDTDPELRAFILARIDGMAFPALAAAIADAFPLERRVRKSALHA